MHIGSFFVIIIMMKYIPTIGLEIHAELKTATKMFCNCKNDADERHPNQNVCPVCLGHPGVLPTINKTAIEMIVKFGLALEAEVSKLFSFDRKNYFYPDLPKGYQISQHHQPVIKGGMINGIRINHVHLEEDAGRLVHPSNIEHLTSNFSLVDFNRAGMPLMELVTEPDIHGVKDAVAFAKELQLILRYLDISDADLEKGQMRVEANISLATSDMQQASRLGTKVEIKNLNSFRALESALNYEIKRQAEVLDSGQKVVQETRGWDDAKQVTKSQRSKEEAQDYRYFPEPDLPPLTSEAFNLKSLKLSIPELPKEKRERFQKEYSLDSSQTNLLAEDRAAAEYFEEAVSELEADEQKIISPGKIKLIFNYLTSDLRGLMADLETGFKELKITPENFADLVELISVGEISSRVAKDLLRKMMDSGLDPGEIVKQEGLRQVSGEEELRALIKKILAENPDAIADYKKGKINALQFLIGKAMAELKGRANPEALRKLFEESLK